MKFFLTGSSGILGTDIAGQLQQAGHEVLKFTSSDIQLGNFADVNEKVKNFKPEIVIHCAAMTNVDLCEDDREAALLINVVGTQNIAKATNSVGAKLVYISSCGVYGNGKSQPYNELDETHPSTYHHYTKLEGEKRVKEHTDSFLIARPGWLFGGSTAHKKNFVEARRREAENTATLKSAGDKVGSPTYTLDFAKQLITLIKKDQTGTFNIVNEGCASRYDYVSEIVKLFGYEAKVEAVDSNLFPRKANMPDNECLENLQLNMTGHNQMRPWREALKEYIETTYNI